MIQERHILQFMFRHITKNNQQAPPSKKNLRVAIVYYLKCLLFNPKLLDTERNKI